MNEKNSELRRKLVGIADTITQPVIAILISLVLGAIVIFACGANVLSAYQTLVKGAFGNSFYINETLKRATPIIMGGLAVCVAWRSGYEAMGGEGQMIFGAFIAAIIAYYMPGPGIVRIICAMLAAAAIGALYSMLSGWLYEKFEVTFIISTLMLNYIANYIASYFTAYVFKDPEGMDINAVQTGKIATEAQLQSITKGSVHWGFALALICVVIIFILFSKTSFGYKSRMGGLNPKFALYGGINARKMLYIVLIISGVLAGLGGSFEALGAKKRYIDQMIFTTGYAWSGMVAALLANFNPFGTAIASILLAGLANGGAAMQRGANIPLEVCNMIQGVITLLMSVRLIRISMNNSKKRKAAKGGKQQ